MAYRRVSGERKYFKYAECSPDQTLVTDGLYLGEEQGKFGTQHVFAQRDGETIVLNSAGQLNHLLGKYAEKGKTYCNVIYKDKKELKTGKFAGTEAHTFELQVDDGTVAADDDDEDLGEQKPRTTETPTLVL